jgi:hypothetical protein
METNLETKIKELVAEANNKFKKMDELGSQLVILEQSLNESRYHSFFRMHIPDLSESSYFSWEPLEEKNKTWRLFLITEDESKNPIRTALLETKIVTRLKYLKYLELFVDTWLEHLKSEKEYIDKTLEKDNGN